jgi:hypothetical protein
VAVEVSTGIKPSADNALTGAGVGFAWLKPLPTGAG